MYNLSDSISSHVSRNICPQWHLYQNLSWIKYIIHAKEISRTTSNVPELLDFISIALGFCSLMHFAHTFFFAVHKESLGKKSKPIFQIKFKRKASGNSTSLNCYFQRFNTEYQQCKLAFRAEEKPPLESRRTVIASSKWGSQPLRGRWIVLHILAKYEPGRAQRGRPGTRVMGSQQRTNCPCRVQKVISELIYSG